MTSHTPTPGAARRRGISGTFRALGGWRLHLPAFVVFGLFGGGSLALFGGLRAQAEDQRRAAFDREATSVVSNLRSALERPLEILEASSALFEASEQVTRGEFGSFVRPALERHPGVRALEWIPYVPHAERRRYEEEARRDGLLGFEFRERGPGGAMVPAAERERYLPIYYMEPGHPLVLGFDCASEAERLATARRAQSLGVAVASERIKLLDDPPSIYSIVTFLPVHAPRRPRTAENVVGFTCEVFRVRTVAEHAIDDSLRRGLAVALLDPAAPPDKRVLFESSENVANGSAPGQRFEGALRYADRDWRLVLSTSAAYRGDLGSSAWLVLLCGLVAGALLGLSISTGRIVSRLRRQVRAAQRLGQYTLLEKLGEGGGGVVHKARHAMMRRPTAIKFLPEAAEDARTLARFEREVQLTSELTHPNTISIYDYGRTPEGTFYYVMEYVEGINLEQLIELEGRLAPARLVHLLKQVCGALAEAHRVGLIHRDIKPGNLMLCERGGIPDFVKVMDFGLVKYVSGGPVAAAVTESAATTIVGTPLYLAPEAISDPHALDARADLYAVGAVAYFLLVGEPVFTGQTVVDVCTQHLCAAPTPPSERAPCNPPPELESIILRCLAKRPDERFASASALLEALNAVTGFESTWSEQQARDWWARWRAGRAPNAPSA